MCKKLVGDRRELLAKSEIEEPRQVEGQHVEHLAAVELDPLDRKLPPAAKGVRLAAGEPQGGQGGVKTVRASGLRVCRKLTATRDMSTWRSSSNCAAMSAQRDRREA